MQKSNHLSLLGNNLPIEPFFRDGRSPFLRSHFDEQLNSYNKIISKIEPSIRISELDLFQFQKRAPNSANDKQLRQLQDENVTAKNPANCFESRLICRHNSKVSSGLIPRGLNRSYYALCRARYDETDIRN